MWLSIGLSSALSSLTYSDKIICPFVPLKPKELIPAILLLPLTEFHGILLVGNTIGLSPTTILGFKL